MTKHPWFFLLIFLSSLFFICLQAKANSHLLTSVSTQNQKRILKYTRELLINPNKQPATTLPKNIQTASNPFILYMFNDKGAVIYKTRIDDAMPLQNKINKALSNCSNKSADKMYLHILLVTKTHHLNQFGTEAFFNSLFEPQVTGLSLSLKNKHVELTPIDALMNNYDSIKAKDHVTKALKNIPQKKDSENNLLIEIYETIHFGEAFPNRVFTQYYRGHELFKSHQVSYAEIKKRLDLISEWYQNNVRHGQVNYIYYPTTNRFNSKDRTMVRSTMAVWTLNKLGFALNDEKLKNLGHKTMNYYLKKYFNIKASLKAGHLIPSKQASLRGELVKNRYTTAAFMILSILVRGEYETYKKEVELLADWLMSHQKKDGLFWTEFANSQFYMPGHALLAIVGLYEQTKDKKYELFLQKSFAAYTKKLKKTMALGGKNYTLKAPAWFTQPYAKMYLLTKKTEYKNMVFAINDPVVSWYEKHAKQSPWFDHNGMLLPDAGSFGNTAVTGAALESLVDAALIAKLCGDSIRYQKYTKVIKHTVAYLMRLQYTPANTYYIKNKTVVTGGFKSDLINTRIWMDNVWHLTNAFMKIDKEKLLPLTLH